MPTVTNPIVQSAISEVVLLASNGQLPEPKAVIADAKAVAADQKATVALSSVSSITTLATQANTKADLALNEVSTLLNAEPIDHLTELLDVNMAMSPASGDVLSHDGTKWTNVAATTSNTPDTVVKRDGDGKISTGDIQCHDILPYQDNQGNLGNAYNRFNTCAVHQPYFTEIRAINGGDLGFFHPVSMNDQALTDLPDPTNAQDAATKAYVDANSGGGGGSGSSGSRVLAMRVLKSGSTLTPEQGSSLFTFVKNSVGNYDITFNDAFTDMPIRVSSSLGADDSTLALTTTGAHIEIIDVETNDPIDRGFDLVVAGL